MPFAAIWGLQTNQTIFELIGGGLDAALDRCYPFSADLSSNTGMLRVMANALPCWRDEMRCVILCPRMLRRLATVCFFVCLLFAMWGVTRLELVKGPHLKIIAPEVVGGDEVSRS
jgi:hypothetical protein